MAKNVNDSEYWLPSQFLTDDELLMDFKNNPDFKHGFNLNQFGTHSGLGSPVESMDTESDDEEEYMNEICYKMASSSLHDSGFGYANTKGWNLCGSPQSTLCGCKQGSSTVPRSSNQASLYYQQLQVAQFQRLKQQQIMKQGQGQGVLGCSKGGFGQYMVKQQQQQQLAQVYGQNGVVARPMMNSSNFGGPTMQQSQQQLGSGMRAVFLGNTTSGPKKECAGTGVFLPRNVATQTESRKKSGCSTVLLPDRVVQALNLKLEAMDALKQSQVQARCNNGGGVFTPASSSMYRINMVASQQRRNVRTEDTYSQPMSQELSLPQEWTY